MKSPPSLSLQGDRAFIVLDTGHHVRYLQEKQVQQRKENYLDLSMSTNGRSRRSVAEIHERNDRKPMVLDPGKNLTGGGVDEFQVEQHEGLGREAGLDVVLDKVRCLCDYMSGIRRCTTDLRRGSITKMVDYSICVVAVEPRLACLNRYPSCSAESTSFFPHDHGSAWASRSGQPWSCERIIIR
ncbi:unnamed protein product [Calypogeia fissa]